MAAVTSTLGVNAAQVYMGKMRVGKLFRRQIEDLRARGL
jgi:hypothetical protein